MFVKREITPMMLRGVTITTCYTGVSWKSKIIKIEKRNNNDRNHPS